MPRPRRLTTIKLESSKSTPVDDGHSVNTKGDPNGVVDATELKEMTELQQLRNQFEFSNLFQFVTLFHKAFLHSISLPLNIEILEEELLSHDGMRPLYDQIRLSLLSTLQNYRSLKLEEFDKFLQRALIRFYPNEYVKSEKENLEENLEEEEKKPFLLLSLNEQIRILYQLSRALIITPHFRDRLSQLSSSNNTIASTNSTADEASEEFRIDPIAWVNADGSGGCYFLLDDNRLYLQTEIWPDLPVVSDNEGEVIEESVTIKKRKRGYYTGGKKRRRVKRIETSIKPDSTPKLDRGELIAQEPILEWRCLCVNLPDWHKLLEKLSSTSPSKSRAQLAHDKILLTYLQQDVMPVIEEAEQSRLRAIAAREKERQKMQLVANRKRSSRLEEKMIKQREDEARELELLESRARKEEERRIKNEERRQERDRVDKALAREERFRLREVERVAKLARENSINQLLDQRGDKEGSVVGENQNQNRSSTRLLELEKNQLLSEENWEFDCQCGAHGNNYDDGTLIIQCGQCTMWMHVRCCSIVDYLKSTIEGNDEDNYEKLDKAVYAAINKPDAEWVRDQMRDVKTMQRHLMSSEEFVCERCERINNRPVVVKSEDLTNSESANFPNSESANLTQGIKPVDLVQETGPIVVQSSGLTNSEPIDLSREIKPVGLANSESGNLTNSESGNLTNSESGNFTQEIKPVDLVQKTGPIVLQSSDLTNSESGNLTQEIKTVDLVQETSGLTNSESGNLTNLESGNLTRVESDYYVQQGMPGAGSVAEPVGVAEVAEPVDMTTTTLVDHASDGGHGNGSGSGL